MHRIVFLAALLYGLGYLLYYVALFLRKVSLSFWEYLREYNQNYRTEKKYNKTLLGQIDSTKKQIYGKKKEILTAIQIFEQDIVKHKELLQFLDEKLKQDQVTIIAETINREISIKQKQMQIIQGCIALLKKNCLIPIQRDQNGIEALFEILRFNQANQDADYYVQQYNELSSKIQFFIHYNFINFSKGVIIELNQSYREMEVRAASNHFQEMEQNSFNDDNSFPLTSSDSPEWEELPNDGLQNLEELVLKDFGNSIEDFEVLKNDFTKIYNRTKWRR